MKRIARWWVLGLLLVGIATKVEAVQWAGETKEYILFDGGTLDSTEHVSHWIPIRGAARITIRTWSAKSAFGAGTEVDSTFSDSIATWKTAFSDSVSFQASDSLGTVVTARSTIPRSITTHSEPYPICADSVVFTSGFQDSVTTQIMLDNPAVNVQLRGPANGSGYITSVFNIAPNGVAACGDCTMGKGFMRVLITPLRRSTFGGFLMTSGKRVNGLKGLRMVAIVTYRHH